MLFSERNYFSFIFIIIFAIFIYIFFIIAIIFINISIFYRPNIIIDYFLISNCVFNWINIYLRYFTYIFWNIINDIFPDFTLLCNGVVTNVSCKFIYWELKIKTFICLYCKKIQQNGGFFQQNRYVGVQTASTVAYACLTPITPIIRL